MDGAGEDAPYVIATPRLRLRPFSMADVPKVFAMGDEDGMRRWIPDQVYRDLQHAERVVRALIGYTDQPLAPDVRPYVLGIEHQETGELIGHVGLSPARGSIEIGYAVEDRRQGNGFASEAVTAMSRWAALPEILGVVEAGNVRSCRVLEKAGFVRHADEVKHAGGRVTMIVIYRYAPAVR